MRTYSKKSFLAAVISVLAFSSCDKNFEELNTNPDTTLDPSPQYIFTKSQYDGARSALLLMGTMQYTTSFNDVAGFGSKYIGSQSQQTFTRFTDAYPSEINEITEVIRAVQNDPERVNTLAAARIWRAYIFSRLTDLYGDIPYFDAAKGSTENNFKPAYDPQQQIYADLLKELEEAAVSFDASKTTLGGADLIYNGDVTRWQKLAYSLMLRLGMRMTKVDLAGAETWVKKAIAGGVITEDADLARVRYLATGQVINFNPLAFTLLNSDFTSANGNSNPEGGKYHQAFIDFLKNNNDPRLPVFSVVYVNGRASTDPAIQKGMPDTFGSKPADFVTYSEPNQQTLLQLGSPVMLFTPAESHFLLAEAALRGWYTGTPATLYADGIRAAMRQWTLFGSAGEISNADIETYVSAHELTSGTFAQQMEQIYTQFWVGVFPDCQEVFATYRRTGYPALTPNNYPGNSTGGRIFRRFLYPLLEQNLNAEARAAAVARQGADDLMTRVWWDR
ncbi:MAG: SusD/RagB family nutrient-binding outer membrane lipoprotein [Mucilaginibacter polytrichastri]|nr:SusD/RagB family nutrient-binding outer membrane lipoprotein [Mucilaginibacter polytrichastri]